MKTKLLLALAVAAILVAGPLATTPSRAQDGPRDLPTMGMNLTAPSYYDWMIYFNDVTRHGSDWISFDPDNPAEWDDERSIPLTADGYPASLEADQAARQIIFLESDIAPRGDYTLTWQGSGEIGLVIDFSEEVRFSDADAPRQTVTVDPAEDEVHLFIVIYATAPADPIRDVHLYLPGTDENSPRFTSWFLERVAPFEIIRFTDWAWANYPTIRLWENRPRESWATWGAELSGYIGVPYTVMIELANELGIDMWISVPHTADADYMRQLAELVKAELDPGLRVWVEFSNEAWNPIFPVFEDLLAEAEQVAADENLEDHYVYHQYGRRAGEMMAIFDDVFADQPDRLIGVLSGQAGWGEPARFIVDEVIRQDTLQYFDVFAIAPYFGDTWETSVGDINQLSTDFLADGEYSEAEFDTIFDALEAGLELLFSGEGEYGTALFRNREIAREAGLPIVTYEGGQHLVAGYFDSGALDGAYIPVNAHPRMYDIYMQYLNGWQAYGGETIILFHLGGFWNDSETFGHLRSPFQPLEEAHKYRAAIDWLAQQ